MKRYRAAVEVEAPNPWAPSLLPLEYGCAIYARQSTARQVAENRESSEMQTGDLIQKALSLGFREEQIVLYIENKEEDGTIRSASGTLRIDQRERLASLMERVYSGEIKTIIVYSESRLFRDEWQIQVDTFIKACFDADCRVVTNTYQYDFRHRTYDTDQFRLQARIAADYIKNHVKGLLHPAKRRLSMRGLAVTGGTPVGYLIDRDKNSPTFRKLIPYEPHAEVVRYLFHRYHELGGRLYELGREINRHPFVFPDFEGVQIPPRFMPKRVPGGYSISRHGLEMLLTNVVYVGYWMYEGVLVSKNNHQPIVEEGDFWYAFNRMSNTTPEGEEQERIGVPSARWTQITTTPVDALLRDVIESDMNRPVYVNSKRGIYRIYDNKTSFTRTCTSFSVKTLDDIYTQRLIWRLKAEHKSGTTDTPDAMYARLREVQSERERQATGVEQQLGEVVRRIAVLKRNLNLDADTDTLQEWAKELKQLANVKGSLESKIKAVEDSRVEVSEFASLLERVLADWHSLTFDQKRRFVVSSPIRLFLLRYRLMCSGFR